MIQQNVIKDRQLKMLETAFGPQIMSYLFDEKSLKLCLIQMGDCIMKNR